MKLSLKDGPDSSSSKAASHLRENESISALSFGKGKEQDVKKPRWEKECFFQFDLAAE